MNAAEIVKSFSGKRVVVIGDVMLDEYVRGDVTRISPEAPVPVLEIKDRGFCLGGAANAACNVASLGGIASLIGIVGKDQGARVLTDLARGREVDTSGMLASVDRVTTVKTRIVARGQQVVRLDAETRAPLTSAEEDALLAAIEARLAAADACIVSDYAKGVVNDRICETTIAVARRLGVAVVVDPKSRSLRKYRGASILTPNTHELELAAGRPIANDSELASVAEELLAQLDGAALLVTRGALGMSLFAPGRGALHLPTRAKAVYDVVGAGDTVVSAIALGLAVRGDTGAVIDVANHAAGVVVSKPGTATLTQEELLAALTDEV
jgi:rfaE bifunctional protein kinase chain/domain